MARDPIGALVRVRRVALDEARRALAESLEAAEAAARARAVLEAGIDAERQAAESIDAGDTAVEAFARWLPGAQEKVRLAIAAEEQGAADAARARAALTLARGNYEAAAEIAAQRMVEAEAAWQLRERALLDDLTSHLRKPAISQVRKE